MHSAPNEASSALRDEEPPSAAVAAGDEAGDVDVEAHEEARPALGEEVGVVAGVDDVEAGVVEEAGEAGDEARLIGRGDEEGSGGDAHDRAV